jgi:putative hydrolase of the HAD superfamily
MSERQVSIRGVVCDLDGVVRHFNSASRTRLEADIGLAPGTIARLAFDPEILGPAITGAVADATWRENIAAALSRRVDFDIARRAVASWSSSPGRVDPDVLGLVRRVRTTTPVVALTNATSRLLDDLDALGVRHEFDAIVSSAVTGAPKPDAGAFQAAQIAVGELLGSPVAAANLLFIDDDAGYVDAAAQLGWNVVHFSDASSLARTLTEHGLL